MTILAVLLFLPIELTAPSYGHPVHVVRQEQQPQPILGYRWVKLSDVDRFYFSVRGPMWCLHRTIIAPANDEYLVFTKGGR